MSTHIQHVKKEVLYFVTFTCYKWLPLVEQSGVHNYLSQWLLELNQRGILTCGYVFMPNHIHLLAFVKDWSKGLNHVIGESKRFLAYEVVSRLKKHGNTKLLEVLSKGVQHKERLKGKQHQVFRLSFDGKEVAGEDDICKLLDYIHFNPVSGKWNLAKDFVQYEYSSARFYEFGEKGDIEIIHFMDVHDTSEFPVDNPEGG